MGTVTWEPEITWAHLNGRARAGRIALGPGALRGGRGSYRPLPAEAAPDILGDLWETFQSPRLLAFH